MGRGRKVGEARYREERGGREREEDGE